MHRMHFALWVRGKGYVSTCSCHFGETPTPSSRPDHIGVTPRHGRRWVA